MNTAFFLNKKIIFIDTTTSTSDELKRDRTLGAAIAKFQEKGRGQQGNIWHSSPNLNFLGSFRLNFPTPVSHFFGVNLSVCLALYYSIYSIFDKYLSTSNHYLSLKWPNDLILNHKKIGGVLIENTILGDTITQSIVGIGLNINESNLPFSFASSIGKELDIELDLEIFSESFIQIFQENITKFRDISIKTKLFDYTTLLYKKDIPHYYIVNNKKVLGKIKEVLFSGELGVEIEGKIQYFGFKEIQMIYV